MKALFPSPTETWHCTSYEAISPTRPELSVANKTVIVTGGGRGLGADMARGFAAAGAAHVVLIGRTQSTLSQMAVSIKKEFASVTMSTHAADVADEVSIGKVAEQVGKWDILILNAGIIGAKKSAEKSLVADWWSVFETNVKGAMVTTCAFLPFRKPDASLVGVNANMISLSASQPMASGTSAYSSSKFAQARLLEYISAETPDLFVVSVHPGCVVTDMTDQRMLDNLPDWVDDASLPAHFLVWLVSKEARFLRGKFVCVNWDVEELKLKRKEIESSRILEMQVHGWPYGAPMDAMLAQMPAEVEKRAWAVYP